MAKLKVVDQTDWADMYTHTMDVIRDLTSVMYEFLTEAEHQDELANCREVSEDSVEDVELWKECRKHRLVVEFAEYLQQMYVNEESRDVSEKQELELRRELDSKVEEITMYLQTEADADDVRRVYKACT